MPVSSFCEKKYKLAAVSSAVYRAKTYCSSEQALDQELRFIRKQFKDNGYGSKDIERTISKVLLPHSVQEENKPTPSHRVSIEFSGPLFYQLRRLASKFLNVQFVSRSSHSLRNLLYSKSKAPSPAHRTSDCVYAIKCDCEGVYVGETEQELCSRVKQHTDGWRKGSASTGFGSHQAHAPEFGQAVVVTVERDRRVRLLKEAACIRRVQLSGTAIASPNDEQLNRHPGALIPDAWLPVLRHLEAPLP
jgi:hypothetical protein